MSYIPGIGSLRRGRAADKVRTTVSASRYMVSPHWWRWWSSQIARVRSIYCRRRDRAWVRRASPTVRSVRSQLRYCHRQLGATIGAHAVIGSIYDNAPRVRIKSATGGRRFVVVTAVCTYRHLPLIYHFSVGWGFTFGMYSLKCLVFSD